MVANFFIPGKYLYIFCISTLASALLFICIRMKWIKYPKQNVYLFLSVFASIAWMKLLTSCILDVLLYFSLLFKVNETFLAVVIISVGNSLGDLFSISALSELGDESMAFLGTYSSQICNLYTGISLNMILGNHYSFDLFKEGSTSSKLILFLIGFAGFVMMSQTFYGCFSKWIFKKGFIYQGGLTYIVFLIMMVFLVFFN